jgi:Uncharacterised nucleotidyltransferase
VTNGRTKQDRLGARQRRRAAEPLARLLLDSIDDARRGTIAGSEYAGVSLDDLDAAVFMHKVAPAVYLHLRNAADAPAELVDALRARYQQQIARQLQVQADLAQLATVMSDAGIPWVTMKGPSLAEHLWSRPDLRQYIDLDILVDRHHFGAVLDTLVASGSEMVDRNWELIEQQVRAEVSLTLPNGTALDLHWHLVNSPVLRREFQFSTPEMLERSVPVKIGDTTVQTLDPADTLLHLGYHTAHSGGHRLMWLKDVERATADADLDWAEVLRRARPAGLALALAVVLARVERVIGFEKPPPAAALQPARRAPWGLLSTALDRWNPPPALPGDRFSGQISFKNTRASSLGSAVAMLASLKSRRAPAFDPAANELYHDRGGAAARLSYLRVVEHGREP